MGELAIVAGTDKDLSQLAENALASVTTRARQPDGGRRKGKPKPKRRDRTNARRQARHRIRKAVRQELAGVTAPDTADGTVQVTLDPALDPEKAPESTAQVATPESTAAVTQTVEQSDTPAVTPKPPGKPWLIVVPVLLLAFASGALVMYVNSSFQFDFGRDGKAAWTLAGIGVVTELAAMLLPAAGTGLWLNRHYLLAFIAWPFYAACVVMVVLNTLGFAATQIGTTVAARSAGQEDRSALKREIERLKGERDKLPVFVPATAEMVAAARSTKEAECSPARGGRRTQCREREGDLNRVLERATLTNKAADLDRQITAKEAAYHQAPVIAAADPQVETAVAMISWVSAGFAQVSGADIGKLRIGGITIIALLPGLCIAFAVGLLWPARSR